MIDYKALADNLVFTCSRTMPSWRRRWSRPRRARWCWGRSYGCGGWSNQRRVLCHVTRCPPITAHLRLRGLIQMSPPSYFLASTATSTRLSFTKQISATSFRNKADLLLTSWAGRKYWFQIFPKIRLAKNIDIEKITTSPKSYNLRHVKTLCKV